MDKKNPKTVSYANKTWLLTDDNLDVTFPFHPWSSESVRNAPSKAFRKWCLISKDMLAVHRGPWNYFILRVCNSPQHRYDCRHSHRRPKMVRWWLQRGERIPARMCVMRSAIKSLIYVVVTGSRAVHRVQARCNTPCSEPAKFTVEKIWQVIKCWTGPRGWEICRLRT